MKKLASLLTINGLVPTYDFQNKTYFAAPRNSSVGTPGVQSGWSAEVAVVLWRRLLGVFGDVNQIADGKIHALLFQYLMELSNILFKVTF